MAAVQRGKKLRQEIQTYTASALSDKIKEFFNHHKKDNEYKYINQIDQKIIQSHVIEIDFDDFPPEIKSIFENDPTERLHVAMYRAIGEVFQDGHGSGELKNIREEDMLKFKILNLKKFENEIFSRPATKNKILQQIQGKSSSSDGYSEEKKNERISKFGKPLEQIENYLSSQIKKDVTLVKQLIRIFLSTYTNNPINTLLNAPSSDGKTYAVVETSKIFPEEDVILIGRISPTTLIHQNGFLIDPEGNDLTEKLIDLESQLFTAKEENNKKLAKDISEEMEFLKSTARKCVDLKNKILLFLDNPNVATYEMLKPIMSHDAKEIIYKTTKSDGSLSVNEAVIRNWPVFVFCSAKNEDKNEVHEEIKTRVFMTSPNSDVEKYEEANRLTSQRFAYPSWAKGVYENEGDKIWAERFVTDMKKTLTTICKNDNNPVINPFDGLLTKNFPSNQGVSMRHFARLMSFINLETLLNFEFNPTLTFDTKDDEKITSVFTTLDDIDNACKVLKNISTVSPEKIKFMDQIFKPLIAERLDGKQGVTSAQCAEKYTQKFKKPITTKQITENYLKHLVDSGILSSVPNTSNPSQNLYLPTSAITINNLEELKSILIDTVDTDFSGVDSRLEELSEVSIEIRKSYPKINYENDAISVKQLKEILLGKFRKSVDTSLKKRSPK